jgi:hypothetical protein
LLSGGNEALGVGKFVDGYVIAAQGVARRASAKEGATVATVQEAIDKFVLAERAAGVAREVKPETKGNNAARDNQIKNFKRGQIEPNFLKQGIKLGFIDEEAYNIWNEANPVVAASEAPKA